MNRRPRPADLTPLALNYINLPFLNERHHPLPETTIVPATMFKFNLALIAIAIAQATSVLAQCPTPDLTPPVCQTSNASPTVADCQAAIEKLSGPCHQSNNLGSLCTSLVIVGTCKIDVCGFPGAQLAAGVNCGGYLQNILNTCQSGGKVGGLLNPANCNVALHDSPYKLQFSHS